MKTKRVLAVIVAAVVLAGAGTLLYQRGLANGRSSAAAPTMAMAASAPSASTAPAPTERRVLYWHDPMVPGTKFDKPGKSPFMDMQLVPVYAEAEAASDPAGQASGTGGNDAGVRISPRTQQNLGLRVAAATLGTLAPDISVTGSVGWNERDTAIVPARAAGFVEKLYVRAAYDPVAKGQPLAELYVPDWVAAQEEFLAVKRLAASSNTPGLHDLLDGAKQRLRLAGMTDDQIARVEARGTVQARITVTAPIGGVLAELGVREGSSVAAGLLIARIAGLSTVWVNAELPEALAARVRVGTPVEARTAGSGLLKGRVAALLPEVNASTRTLKVRVELANADRSLVPGMFATLQFKPSAGAADAQAVLIPSEAVIATGTRTLVMVAQESGSFMPVEVHTGAEANGQTEITMGLKAGERVVLSGQFLLDSDASLKGMAARRAPDAEKGTKP